MCVLKVIVYAAGENFGPPTPWFMSKYGFTYYSKNCDISRSGGDEEKARIIRGLEFIIDKIFLFEFEM